MSTTLPESLPKGALSNRTKELRSIVTGEADFVLPLRFGRDTELGWIASLGTTSDFLRTHNIPLTEVQSLKTFETSLGTTAQDGPPRARLITIDAKPRYEAAGFFFLENAPIETLKAFMHDHDKSKLKRQASSLPIIRSLNADHPGINHVGSKTLRAAPNEILPTVTENGIAIQNDARFAALSRENGLRLKAVMFPNCPFIIQDYSASEINQKSGAILKKIEEGMSFARIKLHDRWGNEHSRDMTLIPAYALEFLDLNAEGEIRGYKQAQSLRVTFMMQAQVDTDFLNKTRFRLNSGNKGQLAIVERALGQLRSTNERLTVQGNMHRLVEIDRQRRLSGTQGQIKFNAQIAVSFVLHATGHIDDFYIGNGTNNTLARQAMRLPKSMNMIFRSRNYGFEAP